MKASVWDITSDIQPGMPSFPSTVSNATLPEGVVPNSVDVITVIYVLSALHPSEWEQAIHNLYTVCRTPQDLSLTHAPEGSETWWDITDTRLRAA